MYEPLTFLTQQEISRLAQNNRTLFEHLPDMLLLIRDDFVIQRMNPAAAARFDRQEGRKCHQVIAGLDIPCGTAGCPIKCADGGQHSGQVIERKLCDDLYMEYTHVPFEGYRREKLVLLILRDITQRKRNEMELERYSRHIENVLKEKIDLLKESEGDRQQLYREMNHLKRESERLAGRDAMIGESRPIQKLREMIYQVSASDATILITGESGTGKELVADLIHRHSSRADKRYLKLNCAAVAESLLESDLFGYERGAFTGAISSRKGKFEEADGGTIFLDEIGDISPKMQTSLLRVLQDGEILRVGSNRAVSVDVRIIAATNVNLAAAVDAGRFRQDLYYRLNVINLHQPPLRERREDIVLLATNFLVKYRERFNKEITFLPNSVVEKLLSYDWPGNVRELGNAIQRAVLLSRNGMISLENLGISSRKNPQSDAAARTYKPFLNRSLKESVSSFEAEIISSSIKSCGGSLDRVSDQLGLSRTTLYEKMKRYGIDPKKYRNDEGTMAC